MGCKYQALSFLSFEGEIISITLCLYNTIESHGRGYFRHGYLCPVFIGFNFEHICEFTDPKAIGGWG